VSCPNCRQIKDSNRHEQESDGERTRLSKSSALRDARPEDSGIVIQNRTFRGGLLRAGKNSA
jgi:hypothetical protein